MKRIDWRRAARISGALLAVGLSLSLIGFAGYRFSSYDAPIHRQNYVAASESAVADKPLVLFDEAMKQVANRDGEAASNALQQAYEACLNEEGDVRGEHAAIAAEIKFRHGIVLIAMQDGGGAVEAFQESLRLDPHNLEAKYNLELLLLQPSGAGGKPRIVPGSSGKRDQGI